MNIKARFPFRGMPAWAQVISEVFPISHFPRIARGTIPKGMGFEDLGRELGPIAFFAFIILLLGVN